jgi:hypothetical protein
LDPERLSKLTGASSEGILVGTRRGEEALVGTSAEEDLLGGFYHTRKPYLIGSGSSAWGATMPTDTEWRAVSIFNQYLLERVATTGLNVAFVMTEIRYSM